MKPTPSCRVDRKDTPNPYEYFVNYSKEDDRGRAYVLSHGITVHKDMKVLLILSDDDYNEYPPIGLNMLAGQTLDFNVTLCDVNIDLTKYEEETNTLLCYGFNVPEHKPNA